MNIVTTVERSFAAPSPAFQKSTLVVLNEHAVRDLLDYDAVIILVRQAMIDLSQGRIDAPERWAMSVGDNGILALMPGSVPDKKRFGIKVLSLFDPPDSVPPVPGHQGLMLLFDGENGRPLSIIDAHSLTAMRTAAASAVATDTLARYDCTSVAMIGSGEQARWHLRTLRRVRPIEQVRIWGRSAEKAQDFADYAKAQGLEALVCRRARDAIDGADIICTTTRSCEPVVIGDWLSPGQHLNLVGASTHQAREVDEKAVARSRFVVDSRRNALSQAGELRAAIAAGAVSRQHIHAEIGEILAATANGREDPEMITIYKSLGHVAQDLAVAAALYERAADSSHTVSAPW